MDKINTFSISEMKVSGFKNFQEPRTFTFGEITSIIGHNGLGKTTIAEAIAYAVTGVPFFGEASLDRLYSMEQRDMSVALTIIVGDGTTHQLIRSRRNDDTSITYDGYTIRQNDLITMFGEKEVFLSIFNPLYFIEALGDKGRNLLERYLPVVPHDVVMEKLSEPMRELLKDEDLSSPDNMLKYLSAEIREAEKTIIYTEGQRDLLNSQSIEALASLGEKKDLLSEMQTAIAELETKKTAGLDFDAMNEELTNLYTRRDEARSDLNKLPDTSELDALIFSKTAELEKARAQVYISPNTELFASENAAFEGVKTRYRREKRTFDGIRVGISCPVCKQTVTDENIDSIKQSFSDSINSLIAEGNSLRARITEMQQVEEAAKSEFEQQRQMNISKLEKELEMLRQEKATKETEEHSDEKEAFTELENRMMLLIEQIEYGNLTPEEQLKLEDIKKETEKLTTEIETLETPSTVTSDAKDQELIDLKRSVEKNKLLATAVKIYLDERTEIMFAKFDLLNRVRIILYDVVKGTGEIKSTFKFSYDERPYRYLSLSEKIKAGLELSALMKCLTERDYPVFIDNGESVPVIDNIRPTGQIFISQVVKGAALEVSDLSNPTTQQAA